MARVLVVARVFIMARMLTVVRMLIVGCMLAVASTFIVTAMLSVRMRAVRRRVMHPMDWIWIWHGRSQRNR